MKIRGTVKNKPKSQSGYTVFKFVVTGIKEFPKDIELINSFNKLDYITVLAPSKLLPLDSVSNGDILSIGGTYNFTTNEIIIDKVTN